MGEDIQFKDSEVENIIYTLEHPKKEGAERHLEFLIGFLKMKLSGELE